MAGGGWSLGRGGTWRRRTIAGGGKLGGEALVVMWMEQGGSTWDDKLSQGLHGGENRSELALERRARMDTIERERGRERHR